MSRKREVETAFAESDDTRDHLSIDLELRALGTIITLEGADPEFPLKLDSLQQLTPKTNYTPKRPKWLLLSVLPARPDRHTPERAMVWVSDEHRAQFLKVFEDYLQKDTKWGSPRNNELVANIAQIRTTILVDLWQSDGSPPRQVQAWWEIWLRSGEQGVERLREYAEQSDLTLLDRVLSLTDRDVMWLRATWMQLESLPFTAVPLAEIRKPEFIDSIEDLSSREQAEYIEDLATRLEPADETMPAVCHLDTGVARTHLLIKDSLAPNDLHTVVGTSGFDRAGHGTKMAGLALFGNALDNYLVGSQPVALHHRLESVRILPYPGEASHSPRTYGDVTAQAVALPEITSRRKRVFCMPVSTNSDAVERPGEPTLWSSTVDALAVGTSVVSNGDAIQLMTPPAAEAARLLIVSAGNVDAYRSDHLNDSDTSAIRDPGQAWNALTVGAYTEMAGDLVDADYCGWEALAKPGELSPHSRTSLLFGPRPWPIKPDIVMEGGNVLFDGTSMFEPSHPFFSLRTLGNANDQALVSANATSAATAQAARLAALVMGAYPEYWPETIRALLVHSAQWTPTMRAHIDEAREQGLQAEQMMLRRYGWGSPNEDRLLYSADRSVTLVIQDEFIPFLGDQFKVPSFRLHDLPWPRDVLQDLGPESVTLRVTLSYFIEPNASRRGWRQRYQYASHGLRFELQDPLESEDQFIRRINHDARDAEPHARPRSGQVDWLLGKNQRNFGSLHQDVWETHGASVAATGKVAVYPVGGWWKSNRSRERIGRPVRYSLVLSLTTKATDVDLYTPVANLLDVPVPNPIEIE